MTDELKEKRKTSGRKIRCPVCDGTGVEVAGERRTCQCEGCGALFLNPRPSAGDVLKVRDDRFKGVFTTNHSAAIRSDAQAAVEAMRGYHFLVSGKDAPLNAFGKKMLDVGSGLGFRMREFEKYGWTTTGIEASKNARAYTKARMQNVIEGDFDTALTGTFDFILMEDVVEEVPDPQGLVVAVRDALAPKGVACVSVPAPAEDESVAEEKLYRFGEDSLRRLFMESGFDNPRVKSDDGLRMWFQLKRKS